MEATGENACDHGLPKCAVGAWPLDSGGLALSSRRPSDSMLTRPTHVEGAGLLSMDMPASDWDAPVSCIIWCSWSWVKSQPPPHSLLSRKHIPVLMQSINQSVLLARQHRAWSGRGTGN